MAEHKLFKVNQHIILENSEGKVLLLKQSEGWMLPGGRLEEGESWFEGLSREVNEETGIRKFEIFGVVDARTSTSGNTYAVTFAGLTIGESSSITSAEHQEARWFSEYEIAELEFATSQEKEILQKYIPLKQHSKRYHGA